MRTLENTNPDLTPTPTSKAIISLQDAAVSYGNSFSLAATSLAVEQGEKVAIVGKSGAGKSTLLRLLYQTHQNRVALVPQDDGLVETLSVFHNVYMGRLTEHSSVYNLLNLVRPFSRRVSEVQEILQPLSLIDKCFTPVASLSGGQRQRTAVARSMYCGGDVLLADEPVSAVDERQSEIILSLLSEHFSTLIVALHDTQLALNCCDRVIGLKAGVITLDKSSEDLSEADLKQLYND